MGGGFTKEFGPLLVLLAAGSMGGGFTKEFESLTVGCVGEPVTGNKGFRTTSAPFLAKAFAIGDNLLPPAGCCILESGGRIGVGNKLLLLTKAGAFNDNLTLAGIMAEFCILEGGNGGVGNKPFLLTEFKIDLPPAGIVF